MKTGMTGLRRTAVDEARAEATALSTINSHVSRRFSHAKDRPSAGTVEEFIETKGKIEEGERIAETNGAPRS